MLRKIFVRRKFGQYFSGQNNFAVKRFLVKENIWVEVGRILSESIWDDLFQPFIDDEYYSQLCVTCVYSFRCF